MALASGQGAGAHQTKRIWVDRLSGVQKSSARLGFRAEEADLRRSPEPVRRCAKISLPSPAAFALAVSAHPAGIRAVLLIGTASARGKREPFAALNACTQILIAINRQEELRIKCG